MKNTILADVVQMAVTTLELNYVVTVKAPVEMPPKIYRVNWQEVIATSMDAQQHNRAVYKILCGKVLADYNCLVEDSPIMDMFANPIKYERCSYVEFNFPDILDSGKLM